MKPIYLVENPLKGKKTLGQTFKSNESESMVEAQDMRWVKSSRF